jgi:hypothetical protein
VDEEGQLGVPSSGAGAGLEGALAVYWLAGEKRDFCCVSSASYASVSIAW